MSKLSKRQPEIFAVVDKNGTAWAAITAGNSSLACDLRRMISPVAAVHQPGCRIVRFVPATAKRKAKAKKRSPR